jgi:hypothetical protein
MDVHLQFYHWSQQYAQGRHHERGPYGTQVTAEWRKGILFMRREGKASCSLRQYSLLTREEDPGTLKTQMQIRSVNKSTLPL